MKSSLKTSRTILTSRSGSECRSAGAWIVSIWRLMCSHWRGEPLDVAGQLILGRALGGGADDDAGRLREHLLEDLLQARALGVGELARDAVHRAAGHVDEVAAGKRDLAREAGALVADRVLRDLDEHAVAGLERELDATRLVAGLDGIPVDLAGVQHGVAAATDVDERRLHARQHVLHAAEVDVADERGVLVAGDVVLDEHVVFEDGDLDAAVLRAHDHDAVDGLAAREELGLGHDGAATAGLAAVAAALLLGLEAGGALDALRLGDQLDGAPARLSAARRLGCLVPALAACGGRGCGGGRCSRTARSRRLGRRARRQGRDLGRVEHELRRDRRDERLGQQPEADRRHRPVGSPARLGCSGSAGLGRPSRARPPRARPRSARLGGRPPRARAARRRSATDSASTASAAVVGSGPRFGLGASRTPALAGHPIRV